MSCIFIHRRDLRLEDNLSLFKALSCSEYVLPIFIFDPRQIQKNNKNKLYFSERAADFIIKSVMHLKKCYNDIGSDLLILYDEPKNAIAKIMKIHKFSHVAFTPDFSNFAIARDQEICKMADPLLTETLNDICLRPWVSLLRGDKPYLKFSSFYENAMKTPVPTPISYGDLYSKFMSKNAINKMFKKIMMKKTPDTEDDGFAGRANCFKMLSESIKHLRTYEKNRNLLSYSTSRISAHLNMGCVSCRELYHMFRDNKEFMKQLCWRDFYTCIVAFLPGGNEFNHIDESFDKIKWASDAPKTSKKYKTMYDYWKKMMTSKTGFLIIDAAMNELKQTGFLHGRARMILGTFWIKYLLINPFDGKLGSQTGYSRLLTDAIGPSQNKMNHQWLTELDYGGRRFGKTRLAGRKMNIDNSMIKKFDPECLYIKKWLPNLEKVPCKDLVKWSNKITKKYNNIHPAPIFNQDDKYNEWELIAQ